MVDGSAAQRGIAVVGMAGRFPGASDVEALWRNLLDGVDAITIAPEAELVAAGVDPALARDPRYVPARGRLRDVEGFDPGFFGMSPREAELTDPQHRLLLECAWEALERAGHDPGRFPGAIGVFAGAGSEGYLLRHLAPRGLLATSEDALRLGNEPDHLTMRIAYKLDLRGPAVTVQTACSTSLVAVHLASQALLTYQCDLALAGGVSIGFPLGAGHLYQEGGIVSPDGRCRAFDADAQGTVAGDGAGVVALRRLDEALADGDPIHAVILGIATNNDGSIKVGYGAPGVEGQAEVITMAHALAGVDAGSVGYVEAHGTGTRLGDPIEVAALTRAFRETATGGACAAGTCAVGSLKSNVGHLDAAAGVAGLIKAALAVERGLVPPSLHVRRPNPALDLAQSPFYIATALHRFPDRGGPRRAGVSSFGFGGTNAHAVLEEPPPPLPTTPPRPVHLLTLAAKTPGALDAMAANLARWLEERTDVELADLAYTLHVGRKAFPHRRAIVCRDVTVAVAALRDGGSGAATGLAGDGPRAVAMMFPGQGAQRAGMAAALYRGEPTFRHHLDECADRLRPELGLDLRDALYGGDAAAALRRTAIAQPALFAVEYALARLWSSWGVEPAAMIGHSLGEYVAACLAGVFSLDDALRLVAARGRLMESLPAGAMLAVSLPEDEARALLHDDLDLAAINAPSAAVISGPTGAIEQLERRLAEAGVASRRLPATRAFHGAMIEPILDRLREQVRAARPAPPQIPFISNLTGTWITGDEATDPKYWARHARAPVRFAGGLRALALTVDGPPPLLLEVGPGRALGALAGQTLGEAAPPAMPSLAPEGGDADHDALHAALGALWAAGARVDWGGVHAHERRRRIALPTYPFQRRRCWIDAPATAPAPSPAPATAPSPALEPLDALEARLRAEHPVRPIEAYPGLREALHAFSASLVVDYLRRGGVDTRAGAAHRRDALLRQLGVQPRFERLFDAALAGLAEDGILAREGGALRFLQGGAELPAPEGLHRDLLARWPGFAGMVDLLAHAVQSYPDALSGRVEAIGVLYPGGRSDLVDDAARRTVEHRAERVAHRLAIEAVRRAVVAARGRPARLLEVGGGRGALTWPLLEALADQDVSYHFTDLGRVFVDDARAEAARRGVLGRMRFGVLDISADPLAQGFAERGFDALIALDVVHATPDVRATLGHLEGLLAPGGLLALVEATSIPRWELLTWGLAEGFWAFDDGIREGTPLLPLDRWEQVLREQGLTQVAAYPRGEARCGAEHGLILGVRREDAPLDAAAAAPPPAPPRPPRPPSRAPYVAPRNELERRVAEACADLLGLDRVGVDEDFYALGADSLILLRLTDRLARDLGREIPASASFRGATVAKLAQALETPTPSPATSPASPTAPSTAPSPDAPPGPAGPSPLVPLQPEGSRPPLFLVHPAAGVIFPYVELSRLLGPDQPVMALQAVGLDGECAPDPTIEAMAARYAAAIRAAHPGGPYHLGGFSFGGLVAFELAQQLRRLGEQVGLLAIIDEPAPLDEHRPPGITLSRLVLSGISRTLWPHLHDYLYLVHAAGEPRPGGAAGLLPDLGELLRRSPGDVVEGFLARATMANYVPPESRLLALRQPAMVPMFRRFLEDIRLSAAYEPEAFPGRITVFKASDLGSKRRHDPTMGWRALAAFGVDAHAIPGEHLTLLRRPHVEVLADKLRASLEGAQAAFPARVSRGARS